jgi:hypothetical protein
MKKNNIGEEYICIYIIIMLIAKSSNFHVRSKYLYRFILKHHHS